MPCGHAARGADVVTAAAAGATGAAGAAGAAPIGSQTLPVSLYGAQPRAPLIASQVIASETLSSNAPNAMPVWR